MVADSFDKPNGFAFSPDESVLYITDSGANQEIGSYHVERPHHVKAFDVADGRHLVNERLFAVTTPGFPDGIKVDGEGRVYASAFSGVQVFNPSGDLIGEIGLAGAVNFTFGGPDRNVLFITTDDAVWAAVLNATGVLSPASSATEGSLTTMAIIRTRRIIDEEGAEAVIETAETLANEKGYRVVIAVVDPSGELVALRRTVGAQVASSRVAVDKARTAAIFVRPSREMEEQVTDGRLGALALHGRLVPDRRHPAEGRRRSRRRHRHQRRDSGRG